MEKLDEVQQNVMNWLDARVRNFPTNGFVSPTLIDYSYTVQLLPKISLFSSIKTNTQCSMFISNVTEHYQKRSPIATNFQRWVCAI